MDGMHRVRRAKKQEQTWKEHGRAARALRVSSFSVDPSVLYPDVLLRTDIPISGYWEHQYQL